MCQSLSLLLHRNLQDPLWPHVTKTRHPVCLHLATLQICAATRVLLRNVLPPHLPPKQPPPQLTHFWCKNPVATDLGSSAMKACRLCHPGDVWAYSQKKTILKNRVSQSEIQVGGSRNWSSSKIMSAVGKNCCSTMCSTRIRSYYFNLIAMTRCSLFCKLLIKKEIWFVLETNSPTLSPHGSILSLALKSDIVYIHAGSFTVGENFLGMEVTC
jgi:hypothetical protein